MRHLHTHRQTAVKRTTLAKHTHTDTPHHAHTERSIRHRHAGTMQKSWCAQPTRTRHPLTNARPENARTTPPLRTVGVQCGSCFTAETHLAFLCRLCRVSPPSLSSNCARSTPASSPALCSLTSAEHRHAPLDHPTPGTLHGLSHAPLPGVLGTRQPLSRPSATAVRFRI